MKNMMAILSLLAISFTAAENRAYAESLKGNELSWLRAVTESAISNIDLNIEGATDKGLICFSIGKLESALTTEAMFIMNSENTTTEQKESLNLIMPLLADIKEFCNLPIVIQSNGNAINMGSVLGSGVGYRVGIQPQQGWYSKNPAKSLKDVRAKAFTISNILSEQLKVK